MYHVFLNRAAGVYLFLYFFNFLSLKFQNIKFLLHFSVRPTKLKLDTHMGKGLIYCVHQIQATRIYLFLYFSSFFCLSNWQRLKTCIYTIVSTYLWWLRPGVCELCSLSAIFGMKALRLVNPYLPNGLVHPYHLDVCILKFRGASYTFYAPNFKEVEGAYWFGPVRLWCVSLCIRSRMLRDRILKFYMWNKYEN